MTIGKGEKQMSKSKLMVLFTGGIINLVIVLYYNTPPDVILLLIIIFWLIVGKLYALKDQLFIILAICFLILTPFPLFFDNQPLANRFAIWQFIYIIIAIGNWIFSELPLLSIKKASTFPINFINKIKKIF